MVNQGAPATSDLNVDMQTVAQHIVRETKVHLNLGQDALIITEDKMRLCLASRFEQALAREKWKAPAGVFLTVLIALATADFKDRSLPAAVWEAVFIVVGVLNGWNAIYWICRRPKSPTVEDIVKEMKRVGVSKT